MISNITKSWLLIIQSTICCSDQGTIHYNKCWQQYDYSKYGPHQNQGYYLPEQYQCHKPLHNSIYYSPWIRYRCPPTLSNFDIGKFGYYYTEHMINHMMYHMIYHTTNCMINQMIDHSIRRIVYHMISHMINIEHTINHMMYHMIYHTENHTIIQMSDHSIRCMVYHMIGHMIGHMINLMINLMIDHLVNHIYIF